MSDREQTSEDADSSLESRDAPSSVVLRADVEAAFRDWLKRVRESDGPATDMFLAEHRPEVAAELARILRDYRGLSDSLSAGPGALTAGRRIATYTLVREVGRGGMGVVWEAVQDVPRRRVALKVLYPHLTLSERALQRFRTEAEAAGRLTHTGIVTLYEVGESEHVHYIAQELVPGGLSLADTLSDLRERGTIPSGWYRHVAQQFHCIASALQSAHVEGVIHRDLKPQNILIAPDGSTRIADFGLAKVQDEVTVTRTGDLAGTPSYMSPEQASPRGPGIDARTDVFSLGVSLYECLTLERPFQADTPQQLTERILLHDPQDPRAVRPGVPRDLAVICLKMLEKRRERRYPSALAVAEDLARYLAHEPIVAKPPNLLGRAGRWVQRHPVLAVGAAGILLAFVALSVGILNARTERSHAVELAALTWRGAMLLDSSRAAPSAADHADVARGLEEWAEGAATRGDHGGLENALLMAGRARLLSGDLTAAKRDLRSASDSFDSREPIADRGRLEVLRALIDLGLETDEFLATQQRLREAHALAEQVLPPGDPTTTELFSDLLLSLRRSEDYPALERLDLGDAGKLVARFEHEYQDAVAREGSVRDTLSAHRRLAQALYYQGLYAEAEVEFERIELQTRELHGSGSRPNIEARAWTLTVRERRDDLACRESALAGMIALGTDADDVLADDDPLRARIRWRTVLARLDLRRMLEATAPDPEECARVLVSFRAAAAAMETALGPMHLDTWKAKTGLAVAENLYGSPERALELSRECLAGLERMLGAGHWATRTAQTIFGSSLMKLGRVEAGAACLRDLFDSVLSDPVVMPGVFDFVVGYCSYVWIADRPPFAEATRVVDALSRLVERMPPGLDRANIEADLARGSYWIGRPEQGAEWRARAVPVLREIEKWKGPPLRVFEFEMDVLAARAQRSPAELQRLYGLGSANEEFKSLRRMLDLCSAELAHELGRDADAREHARRLRAAKTDDWDQRVYEAQLTERGL